MRKKVFLPTWRTWPEVREISDWGSASLVPSSLTPPWVMRRRASELLAIAFVSWTSLATERVGAEGRKDSISAEERSFLENFASKSVRAEVAAASPWKRRTEAAASSFFDSIGWAGDSLGNPRKGPRRSRQATHVSSGIDMILPKISWAGSVMPMWLPRDLLIFCFPSVPVSKGVTRTTWGSWPAWR